jgi:hypothetical protein
MTYKDQFVVEVKCKGKILRVVDDIVRLPFGSEYSIYLKNLNSKRASVNISIDGEDVLDGSSLILEANSSSELQGFLRGTTAKNRFKFINKTKEIADYRGDKADDGILRVEFAFEKPVEVGKTIIHEHHHHYDPFHWNYRDYFSGNSNDRYTYGSSNSGDDIVGTARGMSEQAISSENCSEKDPVSKTFFSSSNLTYNSLGVESLGQPLNDEGITVKGSQCHQDFRYGSIGELEPSEVIIIRLKGMTGNDAPVQQPITVQSRLQCSTCGRTSKSNAKFCYKCGTFLE